MRVHHLNCGSLSLIEPVDGPYGPARAVCHCLLIETGASGLVLVDTGIGTHDIARPEERLGADWITYAGPVLDPAETALHQVRALGYAADDVRHILVTHLHNDHIGGLADFPDATVHLHEAEYADAVTGPGAAAHAAQLAHGPRWRTYSEDAGEEWNGFHGVRPFEGLPPEILLVPMGGHTPGHIGVAVHAGDRTLLHAGDTYFYHGEVDRPDPVVHPLMNLIQEGAETDRELRLANVDQLRELVAKGTVEVFSAHDPWELSRLR
ncbi:MBL fold metallo-hydrolase [Actinomadura macrotermitis]|uniref:Putative metallo-hydrolase n=1 Tax=Actinomadura macrotermitis TaxID=2585200 RepID=A0A7K0C7B0_9ACTN|nr:MBL fold metallo-hydrolase [Actinomadura macrotermitis]MQY09359.1 putative metallo-hydrolase [Actinomadura macrotermitis]